MFSSALLSPSGLPGALLVFSWGCLGSILWGLVGYHCALYVFLERSWGFLGLGVQREPIVWTSWGTFG